MMKNTKRSMVLHSFYDRTGLERHLARMAEKGWMLDRIGNFFWHYRRIEPKKLTFSVCYFPKASQFDPEPSAEQQMFYEFCAHAGWELAAANAQLQVFCNDQPDPVPIDTDPVTQVDCVHRTMMRSALPSQAILALLAVMNLAMRIYDLIHDPITLLSTPAGLFAPACWVLLLLLIGVEWTGYFRWHHKAVLAAERGEFLETHSHRALQVGVLVVLAVGMAWFLLSVFASGDRMTTAMLLLMLFLYVPAVYLLVFGIRRFMKYMGAPAGLNRVVTLVGSFVLACAVLAAITFGTIFALDRGWLDQDREPAALPLTVDDLLDVDPGCYETNVFGDKGSMLLGRFTAYQSPRYDAPNRRELPTLYYTAVHVKVPFLYDLCREKLFHAQDSRNDYDPDEWRYRYEPADPAPWGAREAYLLAVPAESSYRCYLLCYEDRIVELHLNGHGDGWDPTPEQMAAVGEKLGG
ncbi:MAG: DUF2812 domain-containing protein [Roseburia sp.]|nr:DUF2812 domain-containing protein [Roseburia sp.]